MIIREANIADVKEMANVHVKTWKTAYKDILPMEYLNNLSIEKSKKGLDYTLSNSENTVLVAEYNKMVVGFVCAGNNRNKQYSEYDGEVFGIYILKEFSNKGLGKKLFKRVAKLLSCQGKKKIILWMLRDNTAEAFYRKMTGVKVAEEAKNIGGKDYPVIAFGFNNIKSIFDC